MIPVNFKGRSMPVEHFLQKIFNEIPKDKIKTSIAELKTYSSKDIFVLNDLTAFEAIETVEDLGKFIVNPLTQNAGVKTFLKIFLNDKNIDFNENALKSCSKYNIKTLFDILFDFAEVTEQPPPGDDTDDTGDIEPPPPPPKEIELSFGKMRKILSACKPTIRDDVDVTQFELTEQMPVTLLNEFYMMIPKSLLIYYGAVAIVPQNNKREVAAVGGLRLHEGRTHILLQEKNIDYKLFREQNTFYVVLFPQESKECFESGELWDGEVYLVECIIDLKQMEVARSTLCIDFGTSNTTVGTYGVKNPDANEPEIVEFLDETGDFTERRPVLPTVVYIESLEGDKVKYLFGYEALKKVIDKDYNPTATVFYEIKRRINSIDAVETVTDEQGRKAELSHREIIRAYIEYVLNKAEQYFERRFNKLHFTAPVKLKDSFIAQIRKMFNNNGRTVNDAAHSIDEGIAIIYNHISERVKNCGNNPPKNEKVLIMDCGGGTTDLACCEYSLDLSGYSKSLNIVTKFENGDSNFGGNNITFRILQLLKIKLAHKLQGKDCSVQQLIKDENKLLSEIDKNHEKTSPAQDDKKIAYGAFETEYEQAENFVPTKFGNEKLLQKKSKLKRNFYYLWQMAEAYKIQFYRANMDFVSVNFNDPDDRKIGIPDDDKYYLYIKRSADGSLEKLTNPMSGVEITNNDIHRLLYADIYSLLKNVLCAYDDNEQELLKYNHYKLSGQSCKITLFTELLKEFIPGKYLRYGDAESVSPDSLELKLACLKGSIYYMRDTEYGEIKPKITMEAPKLIYNVSKIDVDGVNKKVMLQSGVKEIIPTVDVISSEAQRVKYVVDSRNGRRQNTIDFEIGKNRGQEINTSELRIDIAQRTNDSEGKIGRQIVDKLTDIELNKERDGKVFALFAVPSKTGYGFYLYSLSVENAAARYHLTNEPTYFSFENQVTETFFDGSR